MCVIRIVKYSGCLCETKETLHKCPQGDGMGNCGGTSRTDRIVKPEFCHRPCCTRAYAFSGGSWGPRRRRTSVAADRCHAGETVVLDIGGEVERRAYRTRHGGRSRRCL